MDQLCPGKFVGRFDLDQAAERIKRSAGVAQLVQVDRSDSFEQRHGQCTFRVFQPRLERTHELLPRTVDLVDRLQHRRHEIAVVGRRHERLNLIERTRVVRTPSQHLAQRLDARRSIIEVVGAYDAKLEMQPHELLDLGLGVRRLSGPGSGLARLARCFVIRSLLARVGFVKRLRLDRFNRDFFGLRLPRSRQKSGRIDQIVLCFGPLDRAPFDDVDLTPDHFRELWIRLCIGIEPVELFEARLVVRVDRQRFLMARDRSLDIALLLLRDERHTSENPDPVFRRVGELDAAIVDPH